MKRAWTPAQMEDVKPSKRCIDIVNKYGPTSLATIASKTQKPKRVSAQRWRMELARRERPEYYAECGEVC